MQKKFDVIIIGAGAAGLAAAAVFSHHRLSFLVLEARNRLGGRIYSSRQRSQLVELGAEFVHGQAKALQKILKQEKKKTESQKDIHFTVESGTYKREENYWDGMDELLSELKTKKDVQLSKRVKNIKPSPCVKDLLAFVEGFHGADPKRVSTQFVVEAGTPNKNAFIPAGYKTVIDHFRSKIPRRHIVLNSAVRRIKWADKHVEVFSSKKSRPYISSSLLVTLPLSILKSQKEIEWSPRPKTLKENLEYLEMGSVSKVNFEMTPTFWKHHSWAREGLIHSPGRGVEIYWARPPFLISWLGGPQAKILNKKNSTKILSFHRKCFEKDFGITNAEKMIKGEFFHNWDQDPWSKGAYSYQGVGGEDAISSISEPVAETIYFAGEAFTEDSGTVSGAIESGQKAAKNILRAL